MKKVLFSLLATAVLATISPAQSSTPLPNNGSAAQQQSPTELPTNPAPSQNASAEAAGSAQIAPGTVIPAELAKSVDAKKAKPGDQVIAKTTQDMLSNGQVVIPRGAKIVGHVTQAKAREKGESESALGIAFDKVITKNGELPLNASIQALGPPISSFNAGNAPVGNAPMSESGGMPGGMRGSANTSMGGRNTGAGTPSGMPGSPGGNYPQDTGTPGAQGGGRALQPGATGVIGLSGLSLSAGSDGGAVITSQNKNVKLDGGTQVMLRVNSR